MTPSAASRFNDLGLRGAPAGRLGDAGLEPMLAMLGGSR